VADVPQCSASREITAPYDVNSLSSRYPRANGVGWSCNPDRAVAARKPMNMASLRNEGQRVNRLRWRVQRPAEEKTGNVREQGKRCKGYCWWVLLPWNGNDCGRVLCWCEREVEVTALAWPTLSSVLATTKESTERRCREAQKQDQARTRLTASPLPMKCQGWVL
jgi:hypothetical protein